MRVRNIEGVDLVLEEQYHATCRNDLNEIYGSAVYFVRLKVLRRSSIVPVTLLE